MDKNNKFDQIVFMNGGGGLSKQLSFFRQDTKQTKMMSWKFFFMNGAEVSSSAFSDKTKIDKNNKSNLRTRLWVGRARGGEGGGQS